MVSANIVPKHYLPQFTLMVVTMVWGGTFLSVKLAQDYIAVYSLVGFRFAIGTLLLALWLRSELKRITLTEWRLGVVLGCVLFMAYSLQAKGLGMISSSEAAFITALYVPFVPLLQWLFWRKRPHVGAMAGVCLAFVGSVLLIGPQRILTVDVNLGVALTIMGALGAALEIILLSMFARRCDPKRFAFVQLLTVSLLAMMMAFIVSEPTPIWHPVMVSLLLGLGIAVALIQIAMSWAQKTVSATQATLIYAMEPVWAALVGAIAGERLGWWGGLGGCLIVSAVLVSELLKLRQTKFG